MTWLILVLAGFCEIAWDVGLKYTDGFTRLAPSAFTLAAMVASVLLLGVAMRQLPLGTAYAVWTGIGAVGAFTVGIMVFGDQASAMRLVSIGLIVAGIVGLKLA